VRAYAQDFGELPIAGAPFATAQARLLTGAKDIPVAAERIGAIVDNVRKQRGGPDAPRQLSDPKQSRRLRWQRRAAAARFVAPLLVGWVVAR
jgi:hypothetical protein